MIRLRRLFRDRSGAAAIEFGILAPVAVLLLMGTYELTNALVAYMKLTAACDTVGDLVAQQSSIPTATLNDFYTAEQLVMSPLTTNTLGLAIASVTFSSNGTPSVVWHQEFGGASQMTNLTTSTVGLGNAGDTVIVAQATYTYTSLLKYVLKTGIPMTERVYTRPRLVTSIAVTG
jgi:Flp pilus assembly protein TadG